MKTIDEIITDYEKKRNTISDFLNGSSVKTIGNLYQNNTGNLNALVQGGRTYNEKWWDFQA